MKTIDIIVVPSSRPSHILIHAIQLARITGVKIMVLCSKSSKAIDAAKLMGNFGVDGFAVDVPYHYTHQLVSDYFTTTHPLGTSGRGGIDLPLKRNIGLQLAKIVGWEKLLFLDDDIVGIDSTYIHETALALEDYPVSGHRYIDFPDNSVVRHAQRLSGTEPGVVMSAGSMSLMSSKVRGFFPNIYNEDWFFLFDNESAYLFSDAPEQIAYDPFSNPKRASSEEFGDTIAEGIALLSAAGIRHSAAMISDWEQILTQRKKLILGIRKTLKSQPSISAINAVASLDASLSTLEGILASDCHDYVSKWRNDVDRWQARIESLQTDLSIEMALRLFGLCAVHSNPKHFSNLHDYAKHPLAHSVLGN